MWNFFKIAQILKDSSGLPISDNRLCVRAGKSKGGGELRFTCFVHVYFGTEMDRKILRHKVEIVLRSLRAARNHIVDDIGPAIRCIGCFYYHLHSVALPAHAPELGLALAVRQILRPGGARDEQANRQAREEKKSSIKHESNYLKILGLRLSEHTSSEDLVSNRAIAYMIYSMKSALTACLLLGCMDNPAPAADPPETTISNGPIKAKLYLPNANNGYYRGTRFDWSGVIYSLQFEGHDYYGPWYQKRRDDVHDFVYEGTDIVAGPCSAVTGPVEEYSTGSQALGYEDAQPGGSFIKIGIGVLRKPDAAPYDHYRKYDVIDPGKWSVQSGADRVEFIQELNGPDGYAYVYRKTVRLTKGKAQMVLEHSLKNTGRRAIASNVYNHNFLVLDQLPPGPGYAIAFPFEIKTNRPPKTDLAEIQGTRIVYEKTLKDQDVVATGIEGFGSSPKDYDFRVESRAAGAGMRVTSDRPMSRAGLWSIRSVVAVEPYIDFSVEPGKEFTWTLTYDFYTLPARK